MIEQFKEYGHNTALLGMALSYHDPADPLADWWTEEKQAKAHKRANKLAHMGGGHNKFLESITVELLINAPRYWWSEFDTYRVGTTKQSESTMHTLAKRPPQRSDFHPSTPQATIELFRTLWDACKHDIQMLKASLPEGFMQRRMVVTNYKVLQNVIAQRQTHRLKDWQVFCDGVLGQVQYPEWLVKGGE